VTSEENHRSQNPAFLVGVVLAVAGASFIVGLHDLDSLLVLAPPAVVLAYLTLSAAALLAALVAAAGVRRAIGAAVVLVFIAYLLVMAAAWLRFATDPAMFEEQDPEPSVVLKSRQGV